MKRWITEASDVAILASLAKEHPELQAWLGSQTFSNVEDMPGWVEALVTDEDTKEFTRLLEAPSASLRAALDRQLAQGPLHKRDIEGTLDAFSRLSSSLASSLEATPQGDCSFLDDLPDNQ